MNKRGIAIITALMTGISMAASPAVCLADDGSGITKDETVYVVTDSEGDSEDVIVSEHLINENKIDRISDRTTLSDIENVKGDEKFTRGGENLTWEAGGNDIFYQGRTDRELPVKMTVSYKLDGSDISGSELQGKSGDVEIDITYDNSAKYEGNTVPFVVMTGFLVTDSCLKDIRVDNGKVIDDGEKQIVIGMAAPGLAQAAGIGESDLGLGNSVSIKARAENFAVEDMMTIVTNSVFEDIDTDELEALDFDDQIKELDNGSKKLMTGTRLLYNGIDTMDSNRESLTGGVHQLDQGASALYSNLENIKDLVSANASYMNYVNGVLSDSLPALKQESADLRNQLEEISSSAETDDIKPVDKVQDITDTSTLREDARKLRELRDKAPEEDKASYDAIIADMEKAADNESGMISRINGEIDRANAEIQENAASVDNQSETIQAALADANRIYDDAAKVQIVKSVINVPGSLGPGKPSWKYISDTLYGSFFSDGSTPTVVTGAKGLAEGMNALSQSTETLSTGISQLDKGALEVNKGMEKLYSQGIKKIVDLYNNDLKGLTGNLTGLLDAGKGYNSFTETSLSGNGSVKFIYKTRISE
ncbi:MAG: hypothetical protein ACI4KL_04150 [Lentihominibacter sp.]